MKRYIGGSASIGLPPKQARFVEQFLIDLNATQAAVRAGYSPKTAQSQSSRLLSNVMVQTAIVDAIQVRSERTKIDQDWALRMLKQNAEGGLADGERTAVNKSVELAMRHLGMFPDQCPTTTRDAPPQASQGEIDWENIPLDLADRFLELHEELVALQPGSRGLLLDGGSTR